MGLLEQRNDKSNEQRKENTMRNITYRDGNVYEDGVHLGPKGGSGFDYPNRELIKKYWIPAVLAIAALIALT